MHPNSTTCRRNSSVVRTVKSGFIFAKSAGLNSGAMAPTFGSGRVFCRSSPRNWNSRCAASCRSFASDKHRLHRRFERCRVGDGVQVDGRGRRSVAGLVEDVRASRIRQRNRQHRDAGRCGNRERRQADAIGPVPLLSRRVFRRRPCRLTVIARPPAVMPIGMAVVFPVERGRTIRLFAVRLVRGRAARPAGSAGRPRNRGRSNRDRSPADTRPLIA